MSRGRAGSSGLRPRLLRVWAATFVPGVVTLTLKRVVLLAHCEQRLQFVGIDGDVDRHAALTDMPAVCSAHAQIVAPGMALDCRDVGTVDEPVEQLDAQGYHRRVAVGPHQTVAGLKPLEQQPEAVAHRILMRSRRRLPKTNSADAIGLRCIACSTRIDRLLIPQRKSTGSRWR